MRPDRRQAVRHEQHVKWVSVLIPEISGKPRPTNTAEAQVLRALRVIFSCTAWLFIIGHERPASWPEGCPAVTLGCWLLQSLLEPGEKLGFVSRHAEPSALELDLEVYNLAIREVNKRHLSSVGHAIFPLIRG